MLSTHSSTLRAFAASALSVALLGGCSSADHPSSNLPARRAAERTPYTPEPFLPADNGLQPPAPAPAATPKPAPALSVDDTTRLQIFLDRENFGPGKLDGKPGEFTRKAVVRYGRAHHRTLPLVGPELLAALPEAAQQRPFIDYTVTADDVAQIGVMADTVPGQGKQKSLPYTSVLELLGERFHSERDFLRRLNPGMNMDALAAGSQVRVPDITDPLNVTKLAQHGHLLAKRPEFQPRVVMVYTKEKMLDVLEDGNLLASFPITPGSTTLPAPPGTWKIENMASMPYFRYDEAMLEHGVRSDNFVNLPSRTEQPGGRDVDGAQQERHRPARHGEPRNDRARRQPRLHPPGKLGRGETEPSGNDGHDGQDRRRGQAARARAEGDAAPARREAARRDRRDPARRPVIPR